MNAAQPFHDDELTEALRRAEEAGVFLQAFADGSRQGVRIAAQQFLGRLDVSIEFTVEATYPRPKFLFHVWRAP